MTTGEIVAAVIGPISFGLFLFVFNRIHNRAPQIVRVPVEKKVFVPVVVGTTDIPVPPSLQEADMPVTGSSKLNVDVKNCPRCGEDHEDVEFDRFGDKPVANFTHFGKCPTTDEPILIRVGITDDSQPIKESVAAPTGGCTKRCSE